MDSNMTYLLAAFLITVLVLGGYLWTLSRQAQSVKDDFAALNESPLGADRSTAVSGAKQPEPGREAAAH